MSQRNPMNARSQEKPKGKSRKSAASAKLAKPAASSVKMSTDKAKRKQAEKAQKDKRKAEMEQDRKREAVLNVGAASLAEYKRWRRWWWIALIVAIVGVMASWGISIYGNQEGVPQAIHDMMTPVSIGGLVFGYAAIIFALFIDFKKIRPLRKAQEEKVRNLSKRQKRELDKQIALSEQASAEAKGTGKKRMPWAKKEEADQTASETKDANQE